MNGTTDPDDGFDDLIRHWISWAETWLARRGVQHSDRDEIIQKTLFAYVRYGRNSARKLWSYLAAILKHEWARYFARLPARPREVPQLAEPAYEPNDEAVNIRIDLPLLLDRYAQEHPTQAATLRVWLLEHPDDPDRAARKVIENEGGDPNDDAHVDQVKDRFLEYLRRFGYWLRDNLSDYVP